MRVWVPYEWNVGAQRTVGTSAVDAQEYAKRCGTPRCHAFPTIKASLCSHECLTRNRIQSQTHAPETIKCRGTLIGGGEEVERDGCNSMRTWFPGSAANSFKMVGSSSTDVNKACDIPTHLGFVAYTSVVVCFCSAWMLLAFWFFEKTTERVS